MKNLGFFVVVGLTVTSIGFAQEVKQTQKQERAEFKAAMESSDSNSCVTCGLKRDLLILDKQIEALEMHQSLVSESIDEIKESDAPQYKAACSCLSANAASNEACSSDDLGKLSAPVETGVNPTQACLLIYRSGSDKTSQSCQTAVMSCGEVTRQYDIEQANASLAILDKRVAKLEKRRDQLACQLSSLEGKSAQCDKGEQDKRDAAIRALEKSNIDEILSASSPASPSDSNRVVRPETRKPAGAVAPQSNDTSAVKPKATLPK